MFLIYGLVSFFALTIFLMNLRGLNYGFEKYMFEAKQFPNPHFY